MMNQKVGSYMEIKDQVKIICISGKARAGKDTVARLLKEFLEARQKSVKIVHYGDLVKYVCTNFCGWNGSKEGAGRTMLQTVGTDIVRKNDPNYWIKFIHTGLNISWHFQKLDYLIIADCRFPNEIDYWLEQGFDVIYLHVERPQINDLTKSQRNHSSETALDDYTKLKPEIIVNNSVEDLLNQIDYYRNWIISKEIDDNG